MSTTTIPDNLKSYVVLAAAIIAGNGASEQKVYEETIRLANLLSDSSIANTAFDQIAKRDERTEKVATFDGTLLYVDKETSSNRAVYFFKTQESKWHPDGKEYSRGERLESAEARALASTASTSLIGHRVRVIKAIEGGDGVKVRVIRGITDLGVDPAFDGNNPAFAPSFDGIKTAKLAGFQTVSQAVS